MHMKRTTNQESDFKGLTQQLDAELAMRYGTAQKAYDKHNVIDPINTALVGYVEDVPVACGCFKVIEKDTVEIKRMFVASAYRRKGYSKKLLGDLELWAKELGFTKAILETGKGQPEAIGLYGACGYVRIPNYGVYVGMQNSVCMQKELKDIRC